MTQLITDLKNVLHKHRLELLDIELDTFQSNAPDAHDVLDELIYAIIENQTHEVVKNAHAAHGTWHTGAQGVI